MIIICPACSTKFMLSANALGAQGREVRCAKCNHQWHAMPERREPEPLELEATTDNTEFPQDDLDESILEALTAASSPAYKAAQAKSITGHPVWKMAAACLGICMVMLLLMIARDSLQPALSPIYSAMGHYASDGVVLADVNLRELPSRRKQRYEIECNLLNTADELRQVPQLSMKILNEGGEVLAEEESFLENTGQPIPKGKSVPCRGLRFENVFSTSHTIVMDIGSPLELSLRSGWDYPEEDAGVEAEDEEESEEESKHD